jgi:hypothetical protein
MRECYQFETVSMLQHGQSVFDYYEDLRWYLSLGRPPQKYQWKLPEWVDIIDSSELPDYDIMREYMVCHDCGKPICREVDQYDKQHFPNHAEVSAKRWLQYSSDEDVANLIRMDMDAHTVCGDEIEEFKQRPQVKTLLISALCELHSNAAMFGGIESTSFKIKWKRLDKLGRKVLMC